MDIGACATGVCVFVGCFVEFVAMGLCWGVVLCTGSVAISGVVGAAAGRMIIRKLKQAQANNEIVTDENTKTFLLVSI